MTQHSTLGFDPIERAAATWQQRIGDSTPMRLVTSLMRAQQMMLTRIDAGLKPFGLTFARYEVLMLLTFSRTGALPLSKIGQRLQVHPTSVTNAIDRLEAQGFVTRVPDETDRRRTLATLTETGRRVAADATRALQEARFHLPALPDGEAEAISAGLRSLRLAAGDFQADANSGA